MKYTVKVPPTRNCGSYQTTVSGRNFRADALWDYNSALAHDGRGPVKRMPSGTVYLPASKTYINRKGGGYRETVDEFDSRKEAREMLAEYRLCDPAGHYYLSSRACAGW